MAKRSTIKKNPLSAAFDPKERVTAHEKLEPIPTPLKQTKHRETGRNTGKTKPKARLTVHVSQELNDRLKNAVYWSPGLTLASVAENALEAAVRKLEKANGEPFPVRKTELKGGRPLK